MSESDWERGYGERGYGGAGLPYEDLRRREEHEGRRRHDEDERRRGWSGQGERSTRGYEGDDGPYGEPYPGAPRRGQQSGRAQEQGDFERRGGRAGWGRDEWGQTDWRSEDDRWRDEQARRGGSGLMGPGLGSPGFAGMGAGIGPVYGGASWPGEPVAGRGWGSPSHGTGRYAGRGPKGYQRSRERILDDVCEALTRNPEVDASGIEVDVEGDVVVLRGKVLDRGQKRTAEDVSESTSGVRDVRNELEVEKGMVQELTDAITGRDDDEPGDRRASPSRARTSTRS